MSDAKPLPLPEGTVLLPGDKARPKAYRSPLLHARQRHSGAPWHPDYVKETLAQRGRKGKMLPYTDKSDFFSASTIDEAIERSSNFPAIVGSTGNLLIIVRFDHEIGFDAVRGRNTELATVVMNVKGELITVFPGRPPDSSMPLPKVNL